MRHKIVDKVVLEYNDPQLDDREEHSRELTQKNGGLKLDHGTIATITEPSNRFSESRDSDS